MEIVVFCIFLLLRLITVFISIKKEQSLKRSNNAKEYGQLNSQLLILCHFLYYGASVIEGLNRERSFKDTVSVIGLVIYIFSILILYYIIYQIRYVWTLKLLIAPREVHKINKGFLFKYFRHPNYFLSIVPELIGLSLLFHAWATLVIGLTVYLIPLYVRIAQEEKVMKSYFEDYR
jgi:isoprenylcysteine carboxyl methyltransferase (ICMT) family protein YpbQ